MKKEDKERLDKVDSLNMRAVGTKTEASLNLYTDDIDIETLSRILGCNPTEAHKRGYKINPHSPPAKIGRWSLDAPSEMKLPDKLTYLLKSTTNDQDVWDKLSLTHSIQIRCAVFLHSWTDGFVISSEIITEMGKRHWLFGISVYSAEGNEILDAFLKDTTSSTAEK
jgi:hypothetical protein